MLIGFRTILNFLDYVPSSFKKKVFRRLLNQALKRIEKIKKALCFFCFMVLSTLITELHNLSILSKVSRHYEDGADKEKMNGA